MTKRSSFFDVDMTLYRGYLCSDFNLFLANKGEQEKLVSQTEQEIRSGKLDYKTASAKAIELSALLLKGKTIEQANALLEEFGYENQDKLFPWVSEVFNLLRSKGYRRILVSAAITPLLHALTKYVDADEIYGSEVETENGKYTGKTTAILNFEAKERLINTLVGKLEKVRKIGFGDSVGDVNMLNKMNCAVVVNPHSEDIIALAKTKGWKIVSRNSIVETVRKLI